MLINEGEVVTDEELGGVVVGLTNGRQPKNIFIMRGKVNQKDKVK